MPIKYLGYRLKSLKTKLHFFLLRETTDSNLAMFLGASVCFCFEEFDKLLSSTADQIGNFWPAWFLLPFLAANRLVILPIMAVSITMMPIDRDFLVNKIPEIKPLLRLSFFYTALISIIIAIAELTTGQAFQKSLVVLMLWVAFIGALTRVLPVTPLIRPSFSVKKISDRPLTRKGINVGATIVLILLFAVIGYWLRASVSLRIERP